MHIEILFLGGDKKHDLAETKGTTLNNALNCSQQTEMVLSFVLSLVIFAYKGKRECLARIVTSRSILEMLKNVSVILKYCCIALLISCVLHVHM